MHAQTQHPSSHYPLYSVLAQTPSHFSATALNMLTTYRTTTHQHDPPSFSSTLLDSIYSSFDDTPRLRQHHQSILVREMMTVKTRGDARTSTDKFVDSWMEKMDATTETKAGLHPSSDSSSFGGFSSSDTDSFYSAKKKSMSLKPIRTSFSESFADDFLYCKNRCSDDKPAKGEGSGAGRTAKSRAMKFYGDLKRMKQPISPGGKLATFLNSLFNATGNAKKQRISTSTGTSDTERTPSCSTASSYSRSCLSKTPSSSAAAKRSVRFSPVNVVIDEKFTASTTKSTNRKSVTAEGLACGLEKELKLRAMENNRRVEEAAMDVLKNYNKKWEEEEEDEEEEEEDGESCCSSDLFELENLMQIGVERYSGELPVYETTRLDTIANTRFNIV